MPPACASITPAPTGVPASRPSSAAAAAVSPPPSGVPGSTTCWPMRAKPSSASAPRPIVAEIAVVPAPLMREIGPLAGDGAGRARTGRRSRARSGSRSGRRTARPRRRRRGRFSSSHSSFGVSISGEIAPPTIIQHRVAGRVDALGLVDGAMVHPDDDVALGVAPTARPAAARRHRRARPANRSRRSRCRRRCSARRRPARRASRTTWQTARQISPLDCSTMAPASWNSAMSCLADASMLAGGIEDAGAGAAGAHVDADDIARRRSGRLRSALAVASRIDSDCIARVVLTDRRCWAGSRDRESSRCAAASA